MTAKTLTYINRKHIYTTIACAVKLRELRSFSNVEQTVQTSSLNGERQSADTPSTAATGTLPYSVPDKKSNSFLILPEIDASSVVPALPSKSFNFAAYVNESNTLCNLVKLGVDLSKIERMDMQLADAITKLDFDTEVKPALFFLRHCNVRDSAIGQCISRNPHLLCEPIDNMQSRINYMESKNFSAEAVSRIVSICPSVLTTRVQDIDAQFGYLQKDFKLSGDEVRLVVTRYPKIVIWNKDKIMEVKLTLSKFLGFSVPELKNILLADPRIYVSGKHALIERFNYVHNIMGLSHEDIVKWPRILRTRVRVLRQRHMFLKFLRRDQYNAVCENYVSPAALASLNDTDFCTNAAKVSVQEFNEFLKTL